MGLIICNMGKLKKGELKGEEIDNEREKERDRKGDIDGNGGDVNYDLLDDKGVDYKGMMKEDMEKKVERKGGIGKDGVRWCWLMMWGSGELLEKVCGERERELLKWNVEFMEEG